ncbi:MAG: carbamoyl phosphate synthase small subunit [Psittacicella sp.]
MEGLVNMDINLNIKNSYLVLENGSVFKGHGFGAKKEIIGELVFTTSMTGYQESMTDPSYKSQILTFTYPLIGNYGVNKTDFESTNTTCEAIVIKDLARKPSHWTKQYSLDEYCKAKNIPGISRVDTRSIAKLLRDSGVMRAAIIYDEVKIEETILKLKNFKLEKQVPVVSTSNAYTCPGNKYRVVLIDFGLKENLLRELANRNFQITVLPFNSTKEEVLSYNPDAVVLSNGPGDPEDMVDAIKLVRDIQSELPIFGICLGHQIISLANDAKTYKMKFGHRGCNHPVREIATGQVYFTSQNHGYAVDPNSIDPEKLLVTHIEINDNTIEGVKHKKYPCFSVQFHPEGAPGPNDANHIFDEFVEIIDSFKVAK